MPVQRGSIVLGRKSRATHRHCILIGDDLVSKCDFHFMVRTEYVRIEDILEPADFVMLFDALRGVLQRIYTRYPRLLEETDERS